MHVGAGFGFKHRRRFPILETGGGVWSAVHWFHFAMFPRRFAASVRVLPLLIVLKALYQYGVSVNCTGDQLSG